MMFMVVVDVIKLVTIGDVMNLCCYLAQWNVVSTKRADNIARLARKWFWAVTWKDVVVYLVSIWLTKSNAWKSWTCQQCLCRVEQGRWDQEADQVRHDHAEVGKLASNNNNMIDNYLVLVMLVMLTLILSVGCWLCHTSAWLRPTVTQQGPTPSTSRDGRQGSPPLTFARNDN